MKFSRKTHWHSFNYLSIRKHGFDAEVNPCVDMEEIAKMQVDQTMKILSIEYWDIDEELCPDVSWMVKMKCKDLL